MAANSKIGRLTKRIEALSDRRRGRLTLDLLTDDAWTKINQLVTAGGAPRASISERTGLEGWTDDALLRCLIDFGTLTDGDLRRRVSRERGKGRLN